MAYHTVRPAMTPEEWRERLAAFRARAEEDQGIYADLFVFVDVPPMMSSVGVSTDDATPEDLHAVAALALYGQPFGFTHEDVRGLRYAAADAERCGMGDLVLSLAARIEALLPPEPLTPPGA